MYLTGLATSVPPTRFTQGECWAAMQLTPRFSQLNARSQAVLRKVLDGSNGIKTRHLAIDDWQDAFHLMPDALHARFAAHAPALAGQAAARALDMAQLTAGQIDAILVSTCTGYLCPGLTSYVTEHLGLRADVHALDLVGQGCGAALPNWRTAEALLASGRARHVLSVCVEVCSAALYLDDDPGVLISSCLFGDGAAAAVLSAQPSVHQRRVEWKSSRSYLNPHARDELRFEQSNGMLRNILSRKVPALVAEHAGKLLDDMLRDFPLERDDISGWLLHAGGREVLAAVQNRLGLSASDFGRSAAVLSEFGNVSSPFVLFVLERALAENAPGGWWWLASYGAGFSCHGAILKVD